ncbi:MAG TPA: hypothetical protein VNN25_21870 [Thermoanaerobaculia bacterium]|nr:hypothetical protein [Thermoanaerobaculia bacterium]
MEQKNPLVILTTWIVNYEQHEEQLQTQLVAARTHVAMLEGNLATTQRWLAKFRDLLAILESTNNESIAILERDADATFKVAGTHFERIEAFLLAKKNEPRTVAEIEAGTNIARSSISAVLYRTHSELFQAKFISGQRGKVWSLRNPAASMPPPPDPSLDPPPDPVLDLVGMDEPDWVPDPEVEDIPF